MPHVGPITRRINTRRYESKAQPISSLVVIEPAIFDILRIFNLFQFILKLEKLFHLQRTWVFSRRNFAILELELYALKTSLVVSEFCYTAMFSIKHARKVSFKRIKDTFSTTCIGSVPTFLLLPIRILLLNLDLLFHSPRGQFEVRELCRLTESVGYQTVSQKPNLSGN